MRYFLLAALLVGLVGCGEDDLTVADIEGWWYCYSGYCISPPEFYPTPGPDTTWAMGFYVCPDTPDSAAVWTSEDGCVYWFQWSFKKATSDYIEITAQGSITNQAPATLRFSKEDSCPKFRMRIIVVGNVVGDMCLARLPFEPDCSLSDITTSALR